MDGVSGSCSRHGGLRMKIIGLTGGAGCGKSFVAGVIMKNFPILHISTDDISRRQMRPGEAVYDAVV
ncbi:MAG: dephospho-CoA kinase, partial [Lachnospiraceae bacterium]|nr:dephospho-CoA kinase [Lachnospiraceae bacterium]